MPSNGNPQNSGNNLIYSKRQQNTQHKNPESRNGSHDQKREYASFEERKYEHASPDRQRYEHKPHSNHESSYGQNRRNEAFHEQRREGEKHIHEEDAIRSGSKETIKLGSLDENCEEDKKSIIKLLGIDFFLDDLILIGVILIVFFWLKSDEKKENSACESDAKEHFSIFDKLKGNNFLLPILIFLLFDDFKIDGFLKNIFKKFKF